MSPAALAIGSIVATVAGTGAQVYGQMQSADAQRQAATYNARNAELEVEMRQQDAHENILRQRSENRRHLAEIKSQLAGTGAEVSSGSNADVLGVATTRLEIGIADMARQATNETRSLHSQANMSRWQAQNVRSGALGAVIGGASSLATQAFGYHRAGVFK